MSTQFDVVVLGAGLAACEAAHAATRMGCRTLLLCPDLRRLADVSLNARMGGPARGVLLREIDALGGISGRAADAALLHIRMINETRGPRHRALRAAVDPETFAAWVRAALARTAGLALREGEVAAIAPAPGAGWIVQVAGAAPISAAAVVLALGSTVRRQTSVGRERDSREAAAQRFVENLAALMQFERYHIAHPPLLARETIDTRGADVLRGSATPLAFAHDGVAPPPLPAERLAPIYRESLQHGWRAQIPSYRLTTTPGTNAVLASAWSCVTRGLTSRGPLGCDPLEWIVAGAPAARHALILEPAAWSVAAVYLRGAYTAVGLDDQMRMLATLPGLERARLLRPGLLVEYDGVAPGALDSALGIRGRAGLFAAGAFAGGNGNEEAAGLGLLAGINAALYARRCPPLVLGRADALLGAMADDLSGGLSVPYRVANATIGPLAEVRHDNASLRLTRLGGQLGLVSPEQVRDVERQRAAIEAAMEALLGRRVTPSAAANARLAAAGLAPIRSIMTPEALLRRPNTTYAQLRVALDLPPLAPAAVSVVEARVRQNERQASSPVEERRLAQPSACLTAVATHHSTGAGPKRGDPAK